MDENLTGQLGSKMREAYADMASDVPTAPEAQPRRPSRRLRKSRSFARSPEHKAARASAGAESFLQQNPAASLLIASGVGYVLARLIHR